jgi:hypothetical protein
MNETGGKSIGYVHAGFAMEGREGPSKFLGRRDLNISEHAFFLII